MIVYRVFNDSRVLLCSNRVMADEVQAARDGQPQQQQQQQAVSWWQFLRTFAIQVAIFYFISSFFRGQRQPVDQDGQALSPSVNLFSFGQKVVRTRGGCELSVDEEGISSNWLMCSYLGTSPCLWYL